MSRAPLQALASLYAQGGAPLALVRRDERLAERLAKFTQERIPEIVEFGERMTRVLTMVPDLASLASRTAEVSMVVDRSSIDESDGESESRRQRRRGGSTTSSPPLRARERASRVLTAQYSTAGDEGRPSARAPLSGGAEDETKSHLLRGDRGRQTNHDRDESERAAPRGGGSDAAASLTSRAWREVAPLTVAFTRAASSLVARTGAGSTGESERKAISRLLARLEKESAASSRAPRVGEEAANVEGRSNKHRGAAPASSSESLRQAIERVEAKRADTTRRRHGGGLSGETVAERALPRGAGWGGDNSRSPAAGASLHASHDDTSSSGTPRGMRDPESSLEGFRGLARWAAEQAGDLDSSAAIDRNDGERAPMLQRLHVARRGWDLAADAAWSLDTAARGEGIDLDEVAT